MFRRLPRRARKVLTVLGVLMVILGGLQHLPDVSPEILEEKQGEDLEFTVTGEADIPAALKELIDKKREKPFKLTYADGLEMYIVIGEGPQKGGGYSVAVKELYETDNSIVIRTELHGTGGR
ncbi:MAG: protease complex subunit PrcB family protein [Pilosibacter sp.]